MRKINEKRLIVLLAGVILALSLIIIVSAAIPFTTNIQRTQPAFSTYYSAQEMTDYWPILKNAEDCKEARQDFILNVRPGGCTPAVVRSDLLEEQNVPVFCQIDALQINPLIDVSWIRGIGFKKYPDEVAGVAYHPARKALNLRDMPLTNKFINNIGYVVVVLKQVETEAEMPDHIEVNLTGTLQYDIQSAFGIGKQNFYLTTMNDDEWEEDYLGYNLWKGEAYLRLEDVSENTADLVLYKDKNNVLDKVRLQKGKTSDMVYLPGYQCRAGIYFRLQDVGVPKNKILLDIDGTETWLAEGSKFLDGNCKVLSILSDIEGDKARIKCFGQVQELMLRKTAAVLSINGQEGEYFVGDRVGVVEDEDGYMRNVYLAYVGKIPGFIDYPIADDERTYAVLVKTSASESQFMTSGLRKRVDIAMDRLVHGGAGKYVETVGQISKLPTRRYKAGQEVSEEDRTLTNFKNFVYGQAGGGKEFDVVRRLLGFATEGLTKGSWELEEGNFQVMVLVNSEGHDSDFYNIEDGVFTLQLEGLKSLGDKIYRPEFEEYFKKTKETVEDVVQLYGGENCNDKDPAKVEECGAVILERAAELAGIVEKKESQKEFLEQLKENYPEKADEVEKELKRIEEFDLEKASAVVGDFLESHSLTLLDYKKPGEDDASAVFNVGGFTTRAIMKNEEIMDNLVLDKIEEDYVDVIYSFTNEKGRPDQKPFRIKKNDFQRIDDKKVTLVKINLKKEAVISAVPELPKKFSEANFTVRIGIEKRAIDLSTDKTLERIENLNESIEKFEGIVDTLGDVVKGLKGACYATYAVLSIKNFIKNQGGGAQARQEVMQAWYAQCEEQSGGDRNIFNDCLRENNKLIEDEITSYKKNLGTVNDNLQKIQNDNVESGVLNRKETLSDYRDYMRKYAGTEVNEQKLTADMIDKASTVELRDMELNILNKDLGLVSGNVQQKLERSFNELTEEVVKDNLAKQAQGNLGPSADVQVLENKDTVSVPTSFQKWSEINGGISGADRVTEPYAQVIVYKGGKWIAGFKEPKNKAAADAWYEIVNGEIKGPVGLGGGPADKANIVFIRQDHLQNPWNPDTAKIRFHEIGVDKGLPAIVPIGKEWGLKKGYYVATRAYGTARFGPGQKSYTEAAQLRFFYICNIGKNSVEEFDLPSGDDSCRSIDLDTFIPPSIFGLNSGDTKELIDKARQAVVDAARNYQGGSEYSIGLLDADFKVGVPKIISGVRCQDFMSPQDCHILFNLCDPVLCPPSRCDLGGNYPVSDVIQTGVIGSIALCLPNAREKIYIPVCLTGIHAGLDSYVTMLEAHRDCLQESLDTGKYVGICDEMYSIYLCEMFWRQAIPLAKAGLPKLITSVFNPGARGGVEYLTFQDSWNTLDKSVDYFKNQYGINAVEAFKKRSTGEIGTEFCKMFISLRYPKADDILEALVEPESPVQFQAWFDEIPMTEATVPPTSHYKVYYHIYAGQDQGVYYSVYLKDPPPSGYYSAHPTIRVANGFIPRGDFADETKDFSSPAGYRQLCVRVNDQEECGFNQVSTSYALNYLSGLYAADQAGQNIKSEEECISGSISISSSLYSIAQPNIQEGIGEAINPSIRQRGIVRVCSTEDPGIGTDPKSGTEESRWKNVGYCTNEKVRCWLDTNTVKDVIRDKELEQRALDDIDNIAFELEYEEMWAVGVTEKKVDVLRSDLSVMKDLSPDQVDAIAKRADEIERKGNLNVQKARALLVKFEAYKRFLISLWKKLQPEEVEEEGMKYVYVKFVDGDVLIYKFKNGIWKFRDGTAWWDVSDIDARLPDAFQEEGILNRFTDAFKRKAALCQKKLIKGLVGQGEEEGLVYMRGFENEDCKIEFVEEREAKERVDVDERDCVVNLGKELCDIEYCDLGHTNWDVFVEDRENTVCCDKDYCCKDLPRDRCEEVESCLYTKECMACSSLDEEQEGKRCEVYSSKELCIPDPCGFGDCDWEKGPVVLGYEIFGKCVNVLREERVEEKGEPLLENSGFDKGLEGWLDIRSNDGTYIDGVRNDGQGYYYNINFHTSGENYRGRDNGFYFKSEPGLRQDTYVVRGWVRTDLESGECRVDVLEYGPDSAEAFVSAGDLIYAGETREIPIKSFSGKNAWTYIVEEFTLPMNDEILADIRLYGDGEAVGECSFDGIKVSISNINECEDIEGAKCVSKFKCVMPQGQPVAVESHREFCGIGNRCCYVFAENVEELCTSNEGECVDYRECSTQDLIEDIRDHNAVCGRNKICCKKKPDYYDVRYVILTGARYSGTQILYEENGINLYDITEKNIRIRGLKGVEYAQKSYIREKNELMEIKVYYEESWIRPDKEILSYKIPVRNLNNFNIFKDLDDEDRALVKKGSVGAEKGGLLTVRIEPVNKDPEFRLPYTLYNIRFDIILTKPKGSIVSERQFEEMIAIKDNELNRDVYFKATKLDKWDAVYYQYKLLHSITRPDWYWGIEQTRIFDVRRIDKTGTDLFGLNLIKLRKRDNYDYARGIYYILSECDNIEIYNPETTYLLKKFDCKKEDGSVNFEEVTDYLRGIDEEWLQRVGSIELPLTGSNSRFDTSDDSKNYRLYLGPYIDFQKDPVYRSYFYLDKKNDYVEIFGVKINEGDENDKTVWLNIARIYPDNSIWIHYSPSQLNNQFGIILDNIKLAIRKNENYPDRPGYETNLRVDHTELRRLMIG